jgi:Ca2+-binding RTX toxin-like protein
MGDAADRFTVVGRSTGDRMAAGLSGFSFNSDGDLDVTFTPLPSTMTIVGGAGVNFLTGRGGWGAGLAYPGNLTITGGNSGDELNGGNDSITGGSGNDVINGYGANDTLVGGAGNDRIAGGNDNDTLEAADGQADSNLSGGSGVDTCFFDAGVDPAPASVEIQHPQ